jgi:glycosyltransferase involved in cell wall biosynthesis
MTFSQRILVGLFVWIVAVWAIRHIVLIFVFRLIDVLDLRSPRFRGERPPLVSVIIPAKDEEATLGDCLTGVLAQTYSHIEVIIIDDRSSDRTGEIARRIAEGDPRVRVITIDQLPPGWTGKTHALHLASREARGDWFWFIDSDTRHHPESLAIMLEYAIGGGAVMASLIPKMRCETFWENVVQPLAGIVLMRSFPLFLVNSPRTRLAFANGQYILIERSAYRAAGGHDSVRDRFVEDIYLARRVKALGLRIRVAVGPELSSTRMYTSLPQIVRGWSRILFDAAGRRSWPLIGKILEPLVFTQAGYLGLIVGIVCKAFGAPSGPFANWMLGLGIAHLVLSYSVMYRMYRVSAPTTRFVAWYPVAGLVMDWVLLRSLAMCLTGKVTWRGTAYGAGALVNRAVPRPGVARPIALASETASSPVAPG